MDEIASLHLRIDSLEASIAEKRLDKLTQSGKRAERATDGLMSTFRRLAGPLAAAAGSVASLTKVVDVTREFNILNAQLITATGSASNAAVAFGAIQDFAQKTPYDLQQATDSFTKLVNLGLTPSEKAMTSYGNTASAMGKDLNQLIEAVADAATGEFERLKEFGIKASSQGDKVSFTFRGVTTTVRKNAAEIEDYLIKLGENNFAGAMEERMKTLDGAISNLGDEWNKLFLNISNQGVGDLITRTVRKAIDVVSYLNELVASGALVAYIDTFKNKFNGLVDDFSYGLDMISQMWSVSSKGWGGTIQTALSFITDSIKYLPENLHAVIQMMGVEISALVEYGRVYGAAFVNALILKFDALVAKAKVYGKAIGEAINPFADDTINLDAELASIDQKATSAIDNAYEKANSRIEGTLKARREAIGIIQKERSVAITRYDDEVKSADGLLSKFRQIQAERAKQNEGKDVLGQFKFKPTDGGKATDAQAVKDLEKLRQELRTEEEVIAESYQKRLAIILNNTEKNSQQQYDLKKRLDEQFATQALGDLAAPDTYAEQINQLQEYYNNRRELILKNTQITEEERTALEEELTTQRNERLQALENSRNQMILSSSSDLFGNLATLTQGFAGKQNTLYKAMFIASKAFALADSAIKIQQGIANAASLPWPVNLGAIATTIAATAGVVGTISSINYSGAYDNGGTIPSGKVGLVGEYGPELIAGPANITSRKDTAELFRNMKTQDQQQIQNQKGDTNISFNINAVDAKGIDRLLISRQSTIINLIRRAQYAN